jgi:hypothetical protein
MLIEAFTEAKDPRAPGANEDRFVILPGRAFAVIDGVTDRLGARYKGMLSGQYAATIVKAALERLLTGPDAPDDRLAIVAALTGAIADAYSEHDVLEAARGDWNRRFSATLALALIDGDTIDIVLVGDSGIRIDEARILQVDKDLDRITSTLRQQAWPVVGARTDDPAMQETISRRIAWFGTRQPPEGLDDLLAPGEVAAIEERAIAKNATDLPHVPREHIETLVRGGIIHAQGAYQNDAATILGYSALDGFPVPSSLVHVERLRRSDVATLELFTDGYFKPGARFGVASWEEAFREVERDDPAKVTLYPSPKGSTATHWADDRTYVGVRF